jgi:hypothetical protein
MHNLEEKRMKMEGTLRSIDTLSNLLRKDYCYDMRGAINSLGMSNADEEVIRKKVIELVKSIEV